MDRSLIVRAELRATGADVHHVKNLCHFCVLLEHMAESEQVEVCHRHQVSLASFERCLNLYIQGFSLKESQLRAFGKTLFLSLIALVIGLS